MIWVVIADDAQFFLVGHTSLAHLGRHGKRPSGVGQNILYGCPRMIGVEIRLALIRKSQHGLGGDNGGGASLTEPSGIAPRAKAWTSDVVNLLGQALLLMIE